MSLCIILALSVAVSFNSLLQVALWKNVGFSFTFSTQVPDSIMEVKSWCKYTELRTSRQTQLPGELLLLAELRSNALCCRSFKICHIPEIQHNSATVSVIFGGGQEPVALLSVALLGSGCARNPSALWGRYFQVPTAVYVWAHVQRNKLALVL